jgi:deoxyribodipyrimidine photolyase-related protein
MELFVDAYDWVMVPNVYGMSQYADAGLMSTKPYISGSNYILKMSNYEKGNWCEVWDALYWLFIIKHKNSFAKNPRMSMMVSLANKLSDEKISNYNKNASDWLSKMGIK